MFLSWNCTWLETSDWNCFSRNSDKRSRKVTKTNLDDDNVHIFSEYFYFDIKQSCLFLPFVLSLAVPDDWNMFSFLYLSFGYFPWRNKENCDLYFHQFTLKFFIVTNKVFLAFLAVSSDCRLFVQNILIVPRF